MATALKRVLIIDDEYLGYRESIYQESLRDSFEIEAVLSGQSLFDDIERIVVDFYIIDIVLASWKMDYNESMEVNVTDVLDKIKGLNPEKPVFLVSGQYEKLIKDDKLTRLMNDMLSKSYNILNFIVWNEFEQNKVNNNVVNNVVNRIKLELEKNKQLKRIQEEKFVDVGIVTALKTEMHPFLAKCNDITFEDRVVGNINVRVGEFTTSKGNKLKIALVTQEKMGMVDTAYVTSILVNVFRISHLFMIGVCGGRESQNVNIGDVIIPESSYAYQNGKLTEDGLIAESTSSARSSPINSCIKDTDINSFLANKLTEFNAKLTRQGQHSLGITPPKLRYDPMACGDVVINKADELDRIANDLGQRKLCAVEMESYAIYRANIIYPNVKVSVIKSVMDLTNNKNDTYKDYASFLSAELLFHLLKEDIYPVKNS